MSTTPHTENLFDSAIAETYNIMKLYIKRSEISIMYFV